MEGGDPQMTPERLHSILRSRGIRGIIFVANKGRVMQPQWQSIYEDFSCAVVGLKADSPGLHSALNDHYATARLALSKAFLHGCERPAVILEGFIEQWLEERYRGGFLSLMHERKPRRGLPIFTRTTSHPAELQPWVKRHNPDCIITNCWDSLHSLRSMGLPVPEAIQLIHLDRTPNLIDYAGTYHQQEQIGAAAVDLVVAQIHGGERGIPNTQKCVMIESVWVSGSTFVERYPV